MKFAIQFHHDLSPKRRHLSWLALLLVLLVAFSACATVLRGDRRPVRFNSEPEGAEVFINGVSFGRTPMLLQMKAGETCVVEFRKEGFHTQIRELRSKVKAQWIVLDVICGGIPLVVDAITGAWSEYEPSYTTVVLEEKSKDSPLK